MGRKKGSGLFTGIVTVALAGVVALGAYKWDNLKPALLETKIYTQAEYDKAKEQNSGNNDSTQTPTPTPEAYAVTFISDGQVIENQILTSGSTVEYTGETPTKEGYEFLGWSLDNENIIEDISTVEINGHTTFYAYFEIANSGVFANLSLEELVSGGYVSDLGDGMYQTESTFEDLPNSSLKIPEGITMFRTMACDNIISLYIPKGLTLYSNLYSSNVNLKRVVFADDCEYTEITASLFYGCENLVSINIPNTVTTIGSSAFSKCSSLSKIEIPDTVTTIGSSAFALTPIKNIVLPTNIKKIDSGTFSECKNLESIKIPENVEEISSKAFYGCENLKYIFIPKSVVTIYSSSNYKQTAFYTANKNLKIYLESEEIPFGQNWNCLDENVFAETYTGYTYEQYLEAIGG